MHEKCAELIYFKMHSTGDANVVFYVSNMKTISNSVFRTSLNGCAPQCRVHFFTSNQFKISFIGVMV